MSVGAPCAAIVFGSIAPPQSDVIELNVHLGCTKEVSSFEVVLQNWNGKYSQNGSYPITVGLDGSISIGRGANCPQLITCRVETIRYQSSPVEHYLTVSGRCWGERLFRRVVTATYTGMKGEAIVSDLLDYYVGLSHLRGSTQLIHPTDTTYTKLEYKDTPVMDVLRQIADSADTNGVIGYDFRVAPDAKFEFFPKGTKTNSIAINDHVESCEFTKDITRIRNRIKVYGTADKSIPTDKDQWTESLTPTGGTWTAPSGTISLDSTTKTKGSYSIKTTATNLYYASCRLTLSSGHEVDTDLYPTLNMLLKRETAFNGNATIVLHDSNDNLASFQTTVSTESWFQTQIPVGAANDDQWQIPSSFNWNQVKGVQVTLWFTGVSSGSFWLDGLFFGGCRYSSMQENSSSQMGVGLRELVEVNEELASDQECSAHAKAQLANLAEPTETLTIQSSVLDYGSSPILAGDTIHVELPNEDVDGDYRVDSVEYKVDAKTQTLETILALGKEKPLLADYVYALRSKTSSLSRYKTAKR